MNELPKISIVTPSFNQGKYLAETLQSLVDQAYPHLEVIIQDGGSTDASIEIAREFSQKYPSVFQLYVETDQGQADALNRGFQKATGEIYGFLNSDDCLVDGCLNSVAKEIDPNRDRWIVSGRSVFFGNDPAKENKDHPLEYASHFEQLAIWKRQFNQIPQPSTFWHQSVWKKFGGIDLTIAHALDYDLFCRFSQRYDFHKVPEIWSRYRLHENSKTVNKTHEALIKECIEISRRYWGSWLSPLRWRCEISHGLYQRSRRTEAIAAVRNAEAALLDRAYLNTLWRSLVTAWKAPLELGPRILYPIAATRGWTRLARYFQAEPPEELCPNQWIGPFFETEIELLPTSKTVQIQIEIPDRFLNNDFQVAVTLGNKVYLDWEKRSRRRWLMSIPAPSGKLGPARVQVCSNQYFIPAITGESEDTRFLSCQLVSLKPDPEH